MKKRIALVHAVAVAMQPIADAFARLWPEADCTSILDDSLARDRGSSADVPPEMFRRFEALTAYAEMIGAHGLLFTCSAFGDVIESVARKAPFPVLKPNEAMFELALTHGSRIGMVVTFPPALAPMEAEFYEMCKAHGTRGSLETHCVPDAMEALRKGDLALHNSLVADAVARFDACDAILLGQFSTSPAEELAASRTRVPVLTSPGSAVLKLRAALA
jgi:hypothetical protein